MTIDVPPSLRKARTAAGEHEWLDSLPELVSEMASQWSLAIGPTCDGFGMNALVVEATTTDGTAAVVKLAPPGDAEKLALEATALRLADAIACAERRAAAHDDTRAVVPGRRPPAPRRQAARRRRTVLRVTIHVPNLVRNRARVAGVEDRVDGLAT